MTLTREEVEQRMEPAFAAGDDETLKENLEKDIEGAKASEIDPDDPKSQSEYTFNLDYTDTRGKHWVGEFTSKILTIRERQFMGAMRSRMSGGAAIESLDSLTIELNLMTAHMTYSLIKRPQWAAQPGEMKDVSLIQAIYEEVAAHEARFLGW